MQIETHDGVAVIRMVEGKGNAIGPEFLQALGSTLDSAEGKALVLVGSGRAFSAGLQLPALHPLDRSAMRGFMQDFAACMLRVLAWDRPVVAAVNGHAIAGGCVLALMADVRLTATGEHRIGLNETQLGIGLPPEVIEAVRLRLPPASWVPVAFQGGLFDPGRALQLGLVDELVPPEELESAAIARAEGLAQVPLAAWRIVKAGLVSPALERAAARGADLEAWLDSWESDEARKRVGAVVAKLGG